jgi:hypothetical protein
LIKVINHILYGLLVVFVDPPGNKVTDGRMFIMKDFNFREVQELQSQSTGCFADKYFFTEQKCRMIQGSALFKVVLVKDNAGTMRGIDIPQTRLAGFRLFAEILCQVVIENFFR